MSQVESPCINICKLNAQTGLCEGCMRSMDEIVNWIFYSDPEKQIVLDNIQLRKLETAESSEPK